MDSVYIVEEKNRVHRTIAGVKGQIGVMEDRDSGGRRGDSAAKIGKRVMITCIYHSVCACDTENSLLTQKDCSHKKFGWRDQAHRPLVTNPRLASAAVQFKFAKGQSFVSVIPVCLNVWNEYC